MENIFSNKRYKTVFALFCAFGWSLAYPLIKVGYAEFHIGASDLGGKLLFGGIRFLLAGLLVFLFCFVKKEPLSMKQKSDIWWLILLGLVNIGFHYMCSYIGLGYNPSSRSTVIDSMSGFLLITLSTLFFSDDSFSKNKLLGCLCGIFGIVFMNVNPGGDFFGEVTFCGDGMIVLNTLFSAFGGILTRVVSKKMNMMKATGISMMIGGLFMAGVGVGTGVKSEWSFSWKGMSVLIALTLISAVCFAIYNELLSYHPISQVAIFNALIPVLGVVFSMILLREKLSMQVFVAVTFVAVGIVLVNRKKENGKYVS